MGEIHATKQKIIKISRTRFKMLNLSGMEREMSREGVEGSIWCIRPSP